ncbi:MAG: hypothetical protein GY754_06740 [bacterium]|nr:hypothetical protein [bacterium]
MLKKSSAIHILDACDNILFDKEDAREIRLMLNHLNEYEVNRCYCSYMIEIARQCKEL